MNRFHPYHGNRGGSSLSRSFTGYPGFGEGPASITNFNPYLGNFGEPITTASHIVPPFGQGPSATMVDCHLGNVGGSRTMRSFTGQHGLPQGPSNINPVHGYQAYGPGVLVFNAPAHHQGYGQGLGIVNPFHGNQAHAPSNANYAFGFNPYQGYGQVPPMYPANALHAFGTPGGPYPNDRHQAYHGGISNGPATTPFYGHGPYAHGAYPRGGSMDRNLNRNEMNVPVVDMRNYHHPAWQPVPVNPYPSTADHRLGDPAASQYNKAVITEDKGAVAASTSEERLPKPPAFPRNPQTTTDVVPLSVSNVAGNAATVNGAASSVASGASFPSTTTIVADPQEDDEAQESEDEQSETDNVLEIDARCSELLDEFRMMGMDAEAVTKAIARDGYDFLTKADVHCYWMENIRFMFYCPGSIVPEADDADDDEESQDEAADNMAYEDVYETEESDDDMSDDEEVYTTESDDDVSDDEDVDDDLADDA